ncbi:MULTISPECIES: acyl-ACP--UDP-N-acetylglucosamine O-acyltransferase [Rhodomicrobium]|uniref:acyl-ACP--UDP-N-acetylglucosamine O-acyltransferase n=1 Tax=Rhodomicrobium TaxID=1068 RepID=UPI000B4B79F3|nr:MULTISPECIES: acyl-ACP--UDP-N-acetylglucosamine O-acyltransferase [Rhodomicrobium]
MHIPSSQASVHAGDGTLIHPAAIVEAGARVGANVEIGPFSVIGPEVVLADNVRIHSHVVIAGKTEIGEGTQIFPFASIGQSPQDRKFRGEDSRLIVGSNNVIREYVTMNPGTEQGGLITRVGNNGLFLTGAHIAHDCHIGNNVLLVNNATLGGHCVVGDFASVGGLSAVHQHVRIGAHAFIGGMSGVENDVIPFGMALGNRAHLAGLNIVGMKRHNFDREKIHSLRKAYRMLFATEGTISERLDDVEKMFSEDAHVQRIVQFIKAESSRSLCVPRNGG